MPDSFVEAKTIEVSGTVIVDRLGNHFAVPDENVTDYSDLGARDPLSDLPYEPEFVYQTVRPDQLRQYIGNGWAVVSNKELGRPDAVTQEYGQPLTSAFHVGADYLVKRPKVLAERAMKRHAIRCLETLAALEPSADAVARAREAGFASSFESRSTLLDRIKQTPIPVNAASDPEGAK